MIHFLKTFEVLHGKKETEKLRKEWIQVLNAADRPTCCESAMQHVASGKYTGKQIQTFKHKQWQ
jgi:hypothetical protein